MWLTATFLSSTTLNIGSNHFKAQCWSNRRGLQALVPSLLELEWSNHPEPCDLLRPPALAFLHSGLAGAPPASPSHAELSAKRDTRDNEALLSLQQEALLAWCHHSTTCRVWGPGWVSRSHLHVSEHGQLVFETWSPVPDSKARAQAHMLQTLLPSASAVSPAAFPSGSAPSPGETGCLGVPHK